MNSEFGILYLIPCPISDETAPWDVLPAANRAVMDALDYFIVERKASSRGGQWFTIRIRWFSATCFDCSGK